MTTTKEKMGNPAMPSSTHYLLVYVHQLSSGGCWGLNMYLQSYLLPFPYFYYLVVIETIH